MKVLIVSDSHGLEDELQAIAKRHEKDTDLHIHCGDSELDPAHPALASYLTVKGNCDFYGKFKDEIVVPVGSRKLFLTHGHLHGIKQSLLNVYYRAEELGADIICFGHSHIAGSELMDGKLLINPGSIRLPRVRREKTYAILNIDNDNAEVRFYDTSGQEVESLTNHYKLP
ncbi:metallophosphoesterase [Bacillus sonorensis]|uniref:metallophosphoesterase n=1 Tax=Bacillus sonorensis TaxID=119858 RepID=UPI002DBB45B7|nr:metallophosphoesterase [Bacillus sonorensis]MEC1354927.1 metallophosphoesterase [Bacillus sonorensis]MEC1427129.1 metallophosphoesterase [Bacillus sonorensis]MEC1439470.1 metallophosphoesterase [Bacillus sonorensis]